MLILWLTWWQGKTKLVWCGWKCSLQLMSMLCHTLFLRRGTALCNNTVQSRVDVTCVQGLAFSHYTLTALAFWVKGCILWSYYLSTKRQNVSGINTTQVYVYSMKHADPLFHLGRVYSLYTRHSGSNLSKVNRTYGLLKLSALLNHGLTGNPSVFKLWPCISLVEIITCSHVT